MVLIVVVLVVLVGVGGLVLLLYFVGEWMLNVLDGLGVLFGLNGKMFLFGYIVCVLMEGVMMGMNYGLCWLVVFGVKVKEICVMGGGVKLGVWC